MVCLILLFEHYSVHLNHPALIVQKRMDANGLNSSWAVKLIVICLFKHGFDHFSDQTSFAHDFSSGYLIGEILNKHQLQNDFHLFSQARYAFFFYSDKPLWHTERKWTIILLYHYKWCIKK